MIIQTFKHPLTLEDFVSNGLKSRAFRNEYHALLIVQEYDDRGGYYVYKDALEEKYLDYIKATEVEKDGILGVQIEGEFKSFNDFEPSYYYLDAVLWDRFRQ